MIGNPKSHASIIGNPKSHASIVGYASSSTIFGNVSLGRINIIHGYPEYGGPYDIVPIAEDQIFQTEMKTATENFVVRAIPYNEIENEYGGLTAVIGSGGDV